MIKIKIKKVIKKKKNMFEDLPENLKVVKLKTRKFIQYDFDLIKQFKEINIDKNDIKNAIVKVNIRIKQEDLHKINIQELEKFIRKYAFILKPIVPKIETKRSIRIKELNEAINDPLKAVKIWLLDKNLKNIDKILKISEEIISETEI